MKQKHRYPEQQATGNGKPKDTEPRFQPRAWAKHLGPARGTRVRPKFTVRQASMETDRTWLETDRTWLTLVESRNPTSTMVLSNPIFMLWWPVLQAHLPLKRSTLPHASLPPPRPRQSFGRSLPGRLPTPAPGHPAPAPAPGPTKRCGLQIHPRVDWRFMGTLPKSPEQASACVHCVEPLLFSITRHGNKLWPTPQHANTRRLR